MPGAGWRARGPAQTGGQGGIDQAHQTGEDEPLPPLHETAGAVHAVHLPAGARIAHDQGARQGGRGEERALGASAEVDDESQEHRGLDEAVEGAVDEVAVGRRHPGQAGDAAVEDVADAAERDRPTRELEVSLGDEDPAHDPQDQPREVVEVGGQPQPKRNAHRGIDRPEEPVQQEVAEAQEELRPLPVGVGVAGPAPEAIEHHRQQGRGDDRGEDGEADLSLRRGRGHRSDGGPRE